MKWLLRLLCRFNLHLCEKRIRSSCENIGYRLTAYDHFIECSTCGSQRVIENVVDTSMIDDITP